MDHLEMKSCITLHKICSFWVWKTDDESAVLLQKGCHLDDRKGSVDRVFTLPRAFLLQILCLQVAITNCLAHNCCDNQKCCSKGRFCIITLVSRSLTYLYSLRTATANTMLLINWVDERFHTWTHKHLARWIHLFRPRTRSNISRLCFDALPWPALPSLSTCDGARWKSWPRGPFHLGCKNTKRWSK